MKVFSGYIVPTQNDLFVLIVMSNENNNQSLLFYNSWPQNLSEIQKNLDQMGQMSIDIKKKHPPEICDIANKIALIKQGFDQDTSAINIDYSGYTPKQEAVIKTAIKIPVNEIWPYSRVAEAAGLPKAQRFVGTTMKTLRQPYIVPVHRVKSISFIRKKEGSTRRSLNKKMPI